MLKDYLRKRWTRWRTINDEIVRHKNARTASAEAVVDALDRFMRKEKLSIAKLQNRVVKARQSDADLPVWS